MNLLADTQATPPSVDELLSAMQDQSITEGWDVICAMDADKINTLFAQQYVLQVEQQPTFFTLNGTYTIQQDILSVEFINLVLGPPLISFNPGTDEANLQMNFVSGTVNLLDGNNTIITSQAIAIADQFQVSGSVPLADLVGEVNNHQVVLDISNAKGFTASLGIAQGAETLLGKHFLDFLQENTNSNNPNSFNFVLGTLVYDASGTNLTPVSFDLSTQTSGEGDNGRLLLLIQTTYSSTGGTPNWSPSNFTNIIPDGYSTTLIVSSQAMFQGIVKSTYESDFANVGLKLQVNKTSNGVCSLTSNAGQIDFGVIQTQHNVTGGTAYYWSGTFDWSYPKGENTQHVVLPLSGIQISIQDRKTVSISANLGWGQPWGISYPVPRSEGYQGSETVPMNASISSSMPLSVDPATQIVNFAGTPSINVPVPSPGGDFGNVWPEGGGQLIGQIVSGTNTALTQLFSVGVPAVNTFAVSNLLFPGSHILNFQDVYIPGDLVIFGDIYSSALTTSPVSAIAAAGQTYQFSASSSGKPASATWSLKGQKFPWGQISATGLYTAPAHVSKAQWVQVTATTSDNQSSAILFLVPAGVLLSPDVVILPGTATQQFFAAIDGGSSQSVAWSISPAGVGAIAADGTYTPPASVQAPTAVTITATVQQGTSTLSGSALAVVTAGLTTGSILTTPTSAALAPSQTQKFTATNTKGRTLTPTWSVLAADTTTGNAGSIDQSTGMYTAPDVIARSQVVVVAGTIEDDLGDTFVTTALVYLEPTATN